MNETKNVFRKGQFEEEYFKMLLFYIIIYLMRWCALYLVGAQVGCMVIGMTTFGSDLAVFGMALFMWLIGKGLDLMLGHPNPPKFLDTKKKRIIAAAISVLIGFVTMLDMA